jgi:hypothetical protein
MSQATIDSTTSPATPRQPQRDLDALRRRLIERLATFRRAVRKQLVLEGAARLVVEVAAVLMLALLLDWWLRLSVPMRLSMLGACVIGFAIELWRHVIRPMRMKWTDIDLAAALDRRAPGILIAPRVATVLQLPNLLAISPSPGTPGEGRGEGSVSRSTIQQNPHPNPPPEYRGRGPEGRLSSRSNGNGHRHGKPSPAMIERAVVHASESLANVNFVDHVDPRRGRWAIGAIAGTLVVCLLMTALVPATVSLWARRFFLASNQPWPQDTYLIVAGLTDGRLLVPRGEPHVLRVRARAGSIIPPAVTLKLRPENGKAQSATMTYFGDAGGDFRYELLSVSSPIDVTVRGGDDVVGPFTIEPVDRPRVAKLELTAQHPWDRQPQVYDFSGQNAATSFLPKTEIRLDLTANVPIAEARLTGAASHPSSGDLRRIDDRRLTIAWTHEQPVAMELELVGAGTGLTSATIPISIGLKNDNAPRVSIRHSGVRQRVTPQARIPLTVLARDDYGVTRVDVGWRADMDTGEGPPTSLGDVVSLVGPTTTQAATTQPADQTEIQHAHTLELATLKLSPSALLSLRGMAADACYLGPQKSESSALAFRLVKPEELFREILIRQQGERAQFRKATDEARAVLEKIDTLAAPKDAAALARQHRLIQRETSRIAKSLGDSLTEMKLNALGGPEAYELMEANILAPLRKLHDEPMNQQRATLEALSAALDDAALAAAASQQAQIVETMEQILKQMAQWDSFVDVLNQLNEIIKVQEQARESTEQLRTRQTESIFDE